MTQPRRQQVSLSDTPYYHLICRCVRRTFLCGQDHRTGKNYEHRRQWIEDRIRLLASIFTVDVCAYAVMSNHYHLVVKLSPEQATDWSVDEALNRWTALFKGPLLIQKYRAGETLSSAERTAVTDLANLYRKHLTNLSWFMKCLNEPIARQANKEDKVTGHFWESRFKSQPLLTEEALLSCMAYVDLNPIRARIAETPEASNHTSIQARIKPGFNLADAIQGQIEHQALNHFDLALKPLLHFEGSITNNIQTGLPFHHAEYLTLVDYTGRALDPRKGGAIPKEAQPILDRLGFTEADWLNQAHQFEAQYHRRHSRRAHRAPPKAA
ncbi:transposase [Marinobacter sp.]|uniref:transposase n=1 Tax=Marinobacter sp. TaxID=50741 RepID=UPI00384ADCE4